MKYRIAITGSGNMARTHANHWRNIPDTEIVALISPDQDTASKLPGCANVPVFDRLKDAVARTCFDIVDICTPTPTHVELAVEAARIGKHIFLEKPMARTVDECDTITAAAADAGVVLMIGHVLRYFPEFSAAKAAVDTGAVGSPVSVRTARLSRHPQGTWRNWYANSSLSGGVVLDMIIHDFDWIRWCFGPVTRVYAKGLFGQSKYAGMLDYALVTLRLANGVTAHVTGSWAHAGALRASFEICGDLGMIDYDNSRTTSLAMIERESVAVPHPAPLLFSPLSATDDPFYKELHSFIGCLKTGSPAPVSGSDGRAAVEISIAALRSIETGLPVDIALA